jgi:hypothetical protein
MGYAPTAEQQAVIDTAKSLTSGGMIVQAGPGAGKTATIVAAGNAMPGRKGYYFAFNREIVDSVRKSLPSGMKAYTFNGYAQGRCQNSHAHRVNQKYRMSLADMADYLKLPEIELDDHRITRTQAASMVKRALVTFSKSGDWTPSGWHVSRVNALSPDEMKHVRNELSPYVKEAWADIESKSGKLDFNPGFYIKMWALKSYLSKISADYIVVDESQDVMASVIPVLLKQQKPLHLYGDEYQAINGWNGAEPLSPHFPDFTRLLLSRSFRWGNDVADIVNMWLRAMDADFEMEGTGTTTVGSLDNPDAILCRTNAGTIDEAIRELANNKSVCLIGDVDEFKRIATAALQLQANVPSDHYMFSGFTSWHEVAAFSASDDPAADEIKTWVKLIDAYGAQEISDMTHKLVPRENADVLISTAHKTKGREYGSVRVGNDFPDPDDTGKPLSREDMMLAYVTVSRCMTGLDLGSLAGQPSFS